MYKYAQILNGKVHWIFDHEANPTELTQKYFSPELTFVDITNYSPLPSVGMLYDGISFTDEIISFDLEKAKNNKLKQIDSWTANAITGGFISSASGSSCTYDSEQTDQDNLKLMYIASQDPNFETDETYLGHVPVRAIPQGKTEKEILYLTKDEIQSLLSDLARHIGECKIKGWQLQTAVSSSSTQEELDAIVW